MWFPEHLEDTPLTQIQIRTQNLTPFQFQSQIQIQILLPFSKTLHKVSKLSKSKQTNKQIHQQIQQTQFKTSDEGVKSGNEL